MMLAKIGVGADIPEPLRNRGRSGRPVAVRGDPFEEGAHPCRPATSGISQGGRPLVAPDHVSGGKASGSRGNRRHCRHL